MSEIQAGTLVWVEVSGFNYLKAGVVSSVDYVTKTATIKLETSQTVADLSQVRLMSENCADGVDDMISLTELHEGSLIHTLRVRYKKETVYTYVGSILIALNPYKNLKIYETSLVKEYRGKAIGELPPHVFAIADNVYHSMLKEHQNQCVIISGESGAGKTETTKIILQYLAMCSGKHSQIEERILASSPILESFGNACTVRNNNSSRFGKFIEIQFTEHGVIEGGKINEYLLEKSRIIMQAPNERNYHSFYALLAGLSDELKTKLNLTRVEDYAYLKHEKNFKIDSIDDKEDFDRLQGAFDNLDFTTESQTAIFSTLALILHLGNIDFVKSDMNDDASQVKNTTPLIYAASIMGIDVDILCKALTNRVSITRQETFITPLNISQSCDARDALAKALYSSLFSWLVAKVNEKIQLPNCKSSIGVLDIFGFEDFEINSFEQFCINYANEKLQQFFNNFVFKMEQEEYKNEGIEWQEISFSDNQICLDLISKKPLGILQLLDEESSLPKSSDRSFVEKVRKNHEHNAYFNKLKTSDITFSIHHYAGKVSYNMDGFLDKNRDLLRPDLEKLCADCNFSFLSEILYTSYQDDLAKRATLKLSPGRGSTSQSKKTAGAKFDESLSLLIAMLHSCHPHFVRCIKPNSLKKPELFDEEMVLQQLQYSGLLETVKIRQTGFPVRRSFSNFLQRYNVMIKNTSFSDPKSTCQKFLSSYTSSEKQWQCGKKRIFYKEVLDSALEKERTSLILKASQTIQKYVRGYLVRKNCRKLTISSITIQSAWRVYRKRRNSSKRLSAALKVQSAFKSYVARKILRSQKESSAIILSLVKVVIARARFSYHSDMVGRASFASKNTDKFMMPATAPIVPVIELTVIDHVAESHDERVLFSGASSFTVNSTSEFVPEIEIFLESEINQRASVEEANKFVEYITSKTIHSFGIPIDPCNSHPDFESYEELSAFDFKKYSQTYFDGSEITFNRNVLKKPLHTSLPDQLRTHAIACHQSILVLMGDFDIVGSPLTLLDRFVFILTVCLYNPLLVDEAYCHLIKQLTANPQAESIFRGWIIVLSLFLFSPPSDQLSKYLYKFIGERAPSRMIPLLETRLLRSLDARPRKKIPSFREVSLLMNLPLTCDIILPDQRSISVNVDSLTIYEEIIFQTMSSINVTSYTGWNIYEDRSGIYDMKRNDEHIFDEFNFKAVEILQTGKNSLFPVKYVILRSNFEFDQALRDESLALLAFHQVLTFLHFVREHIDQNLVARLIVLNSKINSLPANWSYFNKLFSSLNIDSYNKSESLLQAYVDEYKNETVLAAMKKFCSLAADISSIFASRHAANIVNNTFIELMHVKIDALTLLIDRNSILFQDARKETLLHFNYDEITEEFDKSKLKLTSNSRTLELYISNPDLIVSNIQKMRDYLAHNNKWAVCIEESSSLPDESLLAMNNGDIIEIISRQDSSGKWFKGKNLSLESLPIGLLVPKSVKILLSKPKNIKIRTPQSIIEDTPNISQSKPETAQTIKRTLSSDLRSISTVNTDPENQEHLSIKNNIRGDDNLFINWALKNFRLEEKKKIFSGTTAFRGTMRKFIGSESLKDHTDTDLEKIEQKTTFSKIPPHHSILKLASDFEKISVEIYQLIMKYMGDYPYHKDQTAVDCSRSIIIKGIETEGLRNEIYCQIMRQVTANPNWKSTQRGYCLMEIVSNYFGPLEDLKSVFLKWLQLKSGVEISNKKHITAVEKNLKIIFKFGGRKSIPTVEEITFLEKLGRPISIQVHLLDKSYKRLPVTPCTAAADIPRQMCSRLGILEQSAHYDIFYLKGLSYIMIFPDDYILDSVYGPLSSSSAPLQYRKIILRRSIIPREYLPANPIEVGILYHQLIELHNSGATKATLTECTLLAALQARASSLDTGKVERNEKELIYKHFIPISVYGTIKPDIWMREIEAQLDRLADVNELEAKIRVLKEASTWPFSGSVIYNLNEPKCDKIPMPNEVSLVITKDGLHLLHGITKNTIATWKFEELTGYSYAPDKLNMKLGGMMSKNQTMFKAETAQGREICAMIDRLAGRL